MAELNVQIHDRTLAKVDKALEYKQAQEKKRKYLGMSQIGDPCWRKLFYSFRHVENRVFSAKGIRAIEDGYLQEDVMAKRLRMVEGIQLITEDPNNPGEQIGFSLLLDHFKGHCDGMILGIEEAPKTWHVQEHKSVNEKKLRELEKLRQEKGEKNALIEWDEIYYAQAIMYMHVSKTERHFLTVSSPGGRHYISVRTNYNRKHAEDLIAKARTIIFDNWDLPLGTSTKREFYRCKWCDYQEICHDGKFALVHCKTCRYSEPVKDGETHCHFHKDISINVFGRCSDHIYNPALVQVKLIEHQEDCCIYKLNNMKFANCSLSGMPKLEGKLDGIYTSVQLRDEIQFITNIKSTEKKPTKKVKKAWE
jgi:hypothetical protein